MTETLEPTLSADAEQGFPLESENQPNVSATALSPGVLAIEAGTEITTEARLDASLFHQPEQIVPGTELPGTELVDGSIIAPARAYQKLIHRLLELEDLNEKLREQDRAKAGFVSMVVHDIRSPLTVILGTLDLLREDLEADRPLDYQHYRHLFTESLNNCHEIDHLIEDMLELARMRENRLRLNFELADCLSVVEHSFAIASGAARQAGVKITTEVQPLLPQVYIDGKQLHRALMNLVNNAIKFTPREGEITIRARLLEERRRDSPCDYVLLSVADTGEGLSPEEAPYVFDAYWQAPNGQRRKGTGLGLAIVKRIAVAHGGNVSVRSQLGKGSTFTIMLPVRDSEPDHTIDLAE